MTARQARAGRHVESGIVPQGDALEQLRRVMTSGLSAYTAADVLRTLLGSVPATIDR